MNIDDFRGKLRDLGVKVTEQVLKNWAYSDEVIDAPEPAKPEEREPGKKGKEASWKEEDIPNVAAAYALRHHPTVKYRPMLELVPDIKQAALMHYHTPTVGFDITPPITSYEDIKVKLQGRPEHLRERISEEKWQELLVTWIATREKAKRGIPIDKPMKVRFNWLSVWKDGVIIDYLPEIVDYAVKDDQHVLLYDSESGRDEIAIICDGVDFRMTMFRMLGFVTNLQ